MLNGVSQLVVTKIDILNIFSSFKAGVEYLRENGEKTDQLPYDVSVEELRPVWEDIEGWKCSLDGINSFEGLPDKAKIYVQYLEQKLGVPVTMVSTGPERKALINRQEVAK